MENNKEIISIYIHWPFCLAKCPYCDFNSHVYKSINYIDWQDAYIADIKYFSYKLKDKYIRSIFFGGGTPSLMNPKIVESIINTISQFAVINKLTEITLEANPTSVEMKKIHAFKLAGINRISLGIQSFDTKELQFLGREHNGYEAKQGLEIIKKYFDNFSFDLIYGLPEHNIQKWKKNLEYAMQLTNKHISLYQLTIERGTPFFNRYHKGEFTLPDNAMLADMYEYTTATLEKKHLKRYEISNYAILGYESKHNLTYWKYNEYLGIGPGAHSRIHKNNNEIFNMWMIYQPDLWLKQTHTQDRIKFNKKLSKEEIFKEIVMMNLRINQGILNTKIFNIFGKNLKDIIDFTILYSLQDDGFLQIHDMDINLTSKGMLICDHIVKILFDLYKD